ncbi:MAG: S53 family peptidase [Bryobacteraceae bacterium]|jgi:subtilase family serine protease
MKSESLRKGFLISAALLLSCQLGFAQSAAIPPDNTLAAKAVAAVQASGTAVPVVPAATVAAMAAARPVIWLSRSLGVVTAVTPATSEPSFCEAPLGSYYVFCPAGLQTAYSLKQIVGANGGAGITIGIVDAFAYPSAQANLAQFDSDMGLPACTTGNGCFTSINLSPYNGTGSGWDLESMLDLEYAHAVAPNAKLLYVQAYDSSYGGLGAAEAAAVAAGADIVSNSWSGGENTSFDSSWNLGKPLLFASGDGGSWPRQGFVGYPCSALTVTCVGGTSLYVNHTTKQRTSEVGWSGSGGGCSGAEPMPAWQGRDRSGVCSPHRASPDIAAIADPDTGVAVYINNPDWTPGYYLVGGTSLATPVSAGLFANIDTARVSFGKAKFTFLDPTIYNAAASNYNYFFYDVTSGNNGYAAGFEFDLVTGLGNSSGPAMANRLLGLP